MATIDRVAISWMRPDGADNFSKVGGIVVGSLTAQVFDPAGLVTTDFIADDDRAEASIDRGDVLFKEVGTGNYRIRWRVGRATGGAALPGRWRLDIDWASGQQWFFESLDTPEAPAGSEPQTIQVRTQGGGAVQRAQYTVKDSAGRTVMSGTVDDAGDATVPLPVAVNYKVLVTRPDLTFDPVTFSVVAGGATTAVTSKLPTLNVLPMERDVTGAVNVNRVLKWEIRNPVTGALIDPFSMDSLEILDTDGSTVLETVTSGSITKTATGKYEATAAGSNLTPAGIYFSRVKFVINSGDSQSTSAAQVFIVSAVSPGLPSSDLCLATGDFVKLGGGALKNGLVRLRQTAVTTKSGKALGESTVRVYTDQNGRIQLNLARLASVQVRVDQLGVDKTVTIPDAASVVLGSLLT